ncbi:hypothetical protein K466DRAFT_582875 [Polyporus arcularius HHB13444]|uniref:Uncharacterized protein n=1 Tax=Polyporus arcularius HHB13444 TaxID=1314778 RepID=A0A5C3PSR3_9APHY|nr:hypothetical protein K466DRAFT_582875 [Polyporus arcularius HHB13444]
MNSGCLAPSGNTNMLGQRIVESFESFQDVKDTQEPHCLPEPPPGLTIRRLKSAGLRIVTESDALWPDVSNDIGNVLCPPTSRQSYLSVRTPDTSHTFGRPNPTTMSPKHPSSSRLSTPSTSTPSPAIRARRLSRYSQAESALRSAVEVSSAEVSPQELQIRALEKATAILSEQARDAQACALKLRQAVKTQKGLSPEEVKLLQRECWLEERRSSARKDQSAQTRDLLTKLCSPISEVPPLLVESPNRMTQREVNLAKFMQLSPTRITVPLLNRCTSTSPVVRDRRQTISQVRPMQLRTSALDLALRSPIGVHRRTMSADGNHSRRGSNSTDATLVSDESNQQTRQAKFNPKLPPSPTWGLGLDGVVRIEQAGSPRLRDSLEAEVGDVSIPDYAVGLLEELVADVTLPALIISSLTTSPSQYPSSSPLTPSPVFARTSLSMPDFTLFELDEPASRPSTPTSPSWTSRPPSRILDRLRSQPDIRAAAAAAAAAPVTTPLRPRPTTANAHLRASVTQSLHNPLDNGSSVFKFSSMRLTSPSLVTVPESDTDLESRPQSSMSGYIFESPETVLGRDSQAGADQRESEGRTIRRRFSLRSFRRERFNSEGVALADPNAAGLGLLARFKRRLTGQR